MFKINGLKMRFSHSMGQIVPQYGKVFKNSEL